MNIETTTTHPNRAQATSDVKFALVDKRSYCRYNMAYGIDFHKSNQPAGHRVHWNICIGQECQWHQDHHGNTLQAGALRSLKPLGTETTGEESAIRSGAKIVDKGGVALLMINSTLIADEFGFFPGMLTWGDPGNKIVTYCYIVKV
jgi:hypothetical protein